MKMAAGITGTELLYAELPAEGATAARLERLLRAVRERVAETAAQDAAAIDIADHDRMARDTPTGRATRP